MIRPIVATKENEYLGEDCALCKQPFAPDTEVVVCPQDGALHHTYCWEENHNHCTALACEGQGVLIRQDGEDGAESAETAATDTNAAPSVHDDSDQPAASPARPRVVITEPQTRPQPARPTRPNRRPTQRPRPAPRTVPPVAPASPPARTPFTIQLAQSCVILSIAIAIIVISFSCFGLWMIADYLMVEVFEFNYRP